MELTNTNQHSPAEQPSCINCGAAEVIPGYTHALCGNCRTAFIRYPIPNKTKLFAAGIAVVLVFAMLSVPKQISTGIHLKRAIAAEKERRFATAEKELHQVLEYQPDYTEALAHLMIASYHNQNLAQLYKTNQIIGGRTMDNTELVEEINLLTQKTGDNMPPETMDALYATWGATDNIPDSSLLNYLAEYPKQTFALMLYSQRLLKQNRYKSCDSLLQIAATVAKDINQINILRIGAKRGVRQFDSALYYCDQLLYQNSENYYALAGKARALLQRGDLREGMELAQKTCKQFPNDGYCIATMALAWHANHQPAKRDALVSQLLRDSTTSDYAQYVIDVINQKEQF